MDITTIGLDLAKNVFQVHGINGRGDVIVRRRLRRAQVCAFSPPCRLVWLAWKLAARRTSGRVNWYLLVMK